MTPPARLAAAIDILDAIAAGRPAEAALLQWSRAARYAGSGDRAAVRDLVFDALRRRRSWAALGGAEGGRGLMLGRLREAGGDPEGWSAGGPHDPTPPTEAERARLAAPWPPLPPDLPGWLADRIAADLGPAAPGFMAGLRERAPVWLRVNRLRGDPAAAIAALETDGIAVVPDPDLSTALRVTEGTRRLSAAAAYRDGLVELQDLSAQAAVAALTLSPGDRVLDFCAGGGGKALAVAARGAGAVVAHDSDPRRMADLPARAARAGAAIGREAAPRGPFDRVIADVPCSGSGTWRRDPDGRWRLTPARLAALADEQPRIAAEAARHLRPGGTLAYMTCSVLRAENEDVAEVIPRLCPGLQLQGMRRWGPPGGSDGFFLAEFRASDGSR